MAKKSLLMVECLTILIRQHKEHKIHGSNNVLISCNHTFQGITITGNKIASTLKPNVSLNLTLHFDRNSESNALSVILVIELSTCHPGFVYAEM